MKSLVSLCLFLGLSLLIHAGILRLFDDEQPIRHTARSVQVFLADLKGPDKLRTAVDREAVQAPQSTPHAPQTPHPAPDAPHGHETEADTPLQAQEETHRGSAHPAIAVRTDSAAELYRNQVLDIIRQNLRYPAVARKRGYEGTVGVLLTLNESGEVGEVLVQESSGFPALDRTSIRTIRRCVFPPPPRGSVTLQIPITFRLVEKP